ncbi:MAG TPA: type II toxin-antitoxin system HicB family antitoxin [Vampirovibrionales bacterium]
MKFLGQCWKDGKFWLIEVPALDLMTQGETKKEALLMIKDAIQALINREDIEVNVESLKDGEFLVGCSEPKFLIALMLKRQRSAHNLTIQEVVDRLGMSSKNAYAQYEQGKHEPTTSKISQFIDVISPNQRIPALF